MTLFSLARRAPRQRKTLLALSALGLGAALAGCGGSGTGSSSEAGVRTVDLVPNSSRATLTLNGDAVSGQQAYSSVSQYQSVGSGLDSISFSLNADPGVTFSAPAQTFSTGDFYSVMALGRADITDASDPRYPSVLVTPDTLTTLSSSQPNLRIIHAAPDLGNVDVLINGAVIESGAAYKSVGSYLNVPSGSASIQINQAGGSSVLVPAQAVNLSAGSVYTLFLVEPAVSPTPAYGIQVTNDTSSVVASTSLRVKHG